MNIRIKIYFIQLEKLQRSKTNIRGEEKIFFLTFYQYLQCDPHFLCSPHI